MSVFVQGDGNLLVADLDQAADIKEVVEDALGCGVAPNWRG